MRMEWLFYDCFFGNVSRETMYFRCNFTSDILLYKKEDIMLRKGGKT